MQKYRPPLQHVSALTMTIVILTCSLLAFSQEATLYTGKRPAYNNPALADLYTDKGSAYNNPALADVEKTFNKFPKSVPQEKTLRVWNNDVIPKLYSMDFTKVKKHGGLAIKRIFQSEEGKNHLQGFIRLPNHIKEYPNLGRHFVISANGKELPQLFIGSISSVPSDGPWAANCDKDGNPKGEDKSRDTMVKMIDINEKGLNHAGGIDVCGKYLAVLLGGGSPNKIIFFDISNPHTPLLLDKITLETAGGSAVALTRLKNSHYLCIKMSSSKTDFYYSKTTNIEDGFYEKNYEVVRSKILGNFTSDIKFQHCNAIRDTNGKLYIINTGSSNFNAPIMKKDNKEKAYLFLIDFDEQALHSYFSAPAKKSDKGAENLITITLKSDKTFDCDDNHCCFRAAASPYIATNKDGSHSLCLYGLWMWTVDDKKVRFRQWVAE